MVGLFWEQKSHCGESDGNTMTNSLIFADDTVILSESLELLVIKSQGTAQDKATGASGMMVQDKSTGAWRSTGWNSTFCSYM